MSASKFTLEGEHGLSKGCLRLEAILAVADRPLSSQELVAAVGVREDEMPSLMQELEHTLRGHALRLRDSGGRFALVTNEEVGEVVASFLESDLARPLSKAALETVAIVAYMQPISRGQVSEVRGVNSEGVIRSLCQRGYLVSQQAENAAGHEPALLRTTPLFLQRFGLHGLEDLEPLARFVPDVDVIETLEEARRRQ